MGSFLVYDDLWIAFGVAAFLALMPVISVIDLEHRIIPNKIVYPALIAFPDLSRGRRSRRCAGRPDPDGDRLSRLRGGAVRDRARVPRHGHGRREACGPDRASSWGPSSLGQVAVAAGAAIVLGGLGAILALLRGAGRKGAMPFGPFLAAGAIVAAFWGPQIADWYSRTFLHV